MKSTDLSDSSPAQGLFAITAKGINAAINLFVADIVNAISQKHANEARSNLREGDRRPPDVAELRELMCELLTTPAAFVARARPGAPGRCIAARTT